MKSNMLITIIASMLLIQGCTSSDPPGQRPLVPPSPTNSDPVTPGITAIKQENSSQFFSKTGISAINMKNEAVLIDSVTIGLALTGSSSCPSVPETVMASKNKLSVKLKDNPDVCTADLGTSYWQIDLPKELTPRMTDLDIEISNTQGDRYNLVAVTGK